MQIALCLHGQPRSLNSSILKYLNTNIDTFIHAWWDGSGRYQNVGLDTEKYTIQLPPTFLHDMYAIFKPKSCLLQQPFHIQLTPNFRDFGKAQPSHIMPMYYSIQNVFKLANSYNLSYDWYVKTRFDVIIQSEPIDFNTLNPNVVYTANIHEHGDPDGTLYIVPKLHIQVFTRIFDSIDQYGGYGVEESVFRNALQKNNIQFQTLHLQYILDRTTYELK